MGRKQQPLTASFQGERGAFSEEAARLLLGPAVEVVPCPRFQQVFERLASGEVDRAVVPIENTLHGSVHENYDHLLNFQLPIRGEVNLRIVHNLIAAPETTYAKVRKVYSHPVAINQCLRFLADRPQLERETFYDTAGSVKMIMETRPHGAAAIASATAAAFYGARILKRSIEDDRRNFTRFFLRSRPGDAEPAAPPGAWKTSVAFTLRNIPGALFRALSAFALRDLSLTKIESRPLRGKPWEYLFYADVLGRDTDPACQRALHQLQEFTDSFHLLGSYPKSV
ncbi:MAG: prephenate dehydratase [Acidobacteria bacterium]|nr:prephenate dehydratase [Bryobacteraceae bacterium CoA2 C42]